MKIISAAFAWPEKKGFVINRPKGTKTFVVIFFRNSVNILSENKKIQAEPFSFIIHCPNQPQWYTMTENTIHDWFHFEAESFDFAEEYGIEFGKIYYPKEISRITDIFSEINTEFFYEDRFSEKYYELKIKELMFLVSKDITFYNERKTKYKDLERLRKKVFQNYSEDWTVKRMADEVNLSVSRFHRLYVKKFGVSPMESLIDYRIKQAQNFLKSGKYSVKEVAQITGYNNEYHFIRQFKKNVGLTPGQFSNQ